MKKNNLILIISLIIPSFILLGNSPELNTGINIEVISTEADEINQDTLNVKLNRIDKIWSEDGFTYKIDLVLESNSSPIRLEIFNMLAKSVKVVHEREPNSNPYSFTTEGLPNGPYFCVLQGQGFSDTYKFTISR